MRDNFEHRLYRESQKGYKKGELDFESYRSLYDRYYDIYSDYLTNLLINLIDYEDAPKTLNIQGLEFMLRQYGYANIIAVDKDNIFVEGIGFDYPGVNVPMGSIIGGLAGSSETGNVARDLLDNKEPKVLTRINADKVKPPVYVTMSNKFSFYLGALSSDSDLIDRTAKTLAEIKASMIVNIRQQKTPFIGFTKDGNLTSKSVWQNLESGKPFIQIDSDAFDNDVKKVITTMPVQTPNLAPTLKDSWNDTMNEFLTFTGVDNVSIDKKERLTAGEASSNAPQVSASLNIYIKARQSQLDLLNESLGTNIKAVVNSNSISDLINFAQTGTGDISDQND